MFFLQTAQLTGSICGSTRWNSLWDAGKRFKAPVAGISAALLQRAMLMTMADIQGLEDFFWRDMDSLR